MKLASLRDGSRDGHLVVVSRDLSTAHHATGIASRLQQVLDDWNFLSPPLQDLYETLNHGKARHAFAFDPAQALAPLPRAGAWAYVGETSAPPALVFDLANAFEAARATPAGLPPQALQLRLALITGAIERGADADTALEGLRLAMVTASAVDASAAAVFCACSPVAVTLDELSPSWSHGRLVQAVPRLHNGRAGGELRPPKDDAGIGGWLATLTAARGLQPGSVIAGAPWRADREIDVRAGDRLSHDLLGIDGLSVFGAIETVWPAAG